MPNQPDNDQDVRRASGNNARPGRVLCLRCQKPFDSVDRTRNRICPACSVINADVRPLRVYSTQHFIHSGGKESEE